jgi:hypothetical protein
MCDGLERRPHLEGPIEQVSALNNADTHSSTTPRTCDSYGRKPAHRRNEGRGMRGLSVHAVVVSGVASHLPTPCMIPPFWSGGGIVHSFLCVPHLILVMRLRKLCNEPRPPHRERVATNRVPLPRPREPQV